MESRRGRPLVITGDVELLDELVRLAGAGGVEVTVAIDALAAADDWARAPLVVVGVDRAPDLVRHAPSPRLGVLLVVRQGDPMPGWSLAEALHAEHVLVLPEAQAWLVDRFAATARPGGGTAAVAPVLAVLGGSTGAGASTLAVALAVAARRRGLQTLLVDGDPRGRGIDPSLGASLSVDASTAGIPGALAADAAVAGRTGTLVGLTFDERPAPVRPEAMAAALQAGRRARDLVVVDLPRTFDDASLLALTCADHGLLVVVAEFRACAAAKRVAATARRHCPTLGLVVRALARRGLRPREVAEALDLPIAGVLPPPPRAARFAQHGRPDGEAGRSPLPRLCRRLLTDLLPPGEPGPPIDGAGSEPAQAAAGTVW